MTGSGESFEERVRDELRRAADAVAGLRHELTPSAETDEDAIPELVGERLALLLGRRLEEVEGAVAVAMALAERTGSEVREELHDVAAGLAEQLDAVAEMAQRAAAAPEASHDTIVQEARFDEVHRRIDAVTRELRAGVASLERQRFLPAPYGPRLAATLGKRIEQVEGEVAVASELAARTGAELRDELADVAAAGEFRRRELAHELSALAEQLAELETGPDAKDLATLAAAWRAELHALDVRLGDELATLREEMRKRGTADPRTDLALRELIARIEIVEGDRDAITAQLVRGAETWASERVALQERVAELAARIVTGPVPTAGDDADPAAWPTARAFDQLRINVEGLRMRLAYHEKAVAELAEGRDADDRIDDMQRLLGRLETAGHRVRGESDTVLDQLERVAVRMERRLEELETADPGPGR